jgi:hypothetical protein
LVRVAIVILRFPGMARFADTDREVTIGYILRCFWEKAAREVVMQYDAMKTPTRMLGARRNTLVPDGLLHDPAIDAC